MKKPNRKRVSSPRNQPKEPEEKKRALISQNATQTKGQSRALNQGKDVTDSRVSPDVTESKSLHRGSHSSEVLEHVTANKTGNTQQSGILRKQGEETLDDENTEFDAHEVALRRALLMESLGLHVTPGRTGTDNADNKTKTWRYSALSTSNSSSPTNLAGSPLNSSMETHVVSDAIKVEVTEPDSDSCDIGAAAGAAADTAQFSSKAPLWQQPSAPVPTGTEIDPSLLVQVSFMLIQSLTLSTEWTVKPHETGITLLMLSKTKPHAVQREIDVHASGSLDILVHRVPLKKDHELWKALPPPVALTENTAENFIHYMRALVYTMRQYPVCSGVSNEQYREIWPEMKQATIDENEFQEARYTQTCRSLKCDIVVKQREMRCHGCRYLYNALRVKVKKPPFTFTPGGPSTYNMTKQEIVEQAKLLQRENINLRETVQRLRGALSRDVSMDASMDQESHLANLTPAQRISLEPKVSPLLRGAFSRDLSVDTSVEQAVQVTKLSPALRISLEPKVSPQLRGAFSRDMSVDSSGDQAVLVTKLSPAQRVSLEPKVSPLLRGAFSRDVSVDSGVDQDVQDTNLTPAPRISLEPKLTPSVQSTEPITSPQTEAKQNCSSPGVCDTTPLTAVVKKLKQRLQTISHE